MLIRFLLCWLIILVQVVGFMAFQKSRRTSDQTDCVETMLAMPFSDNQSKSGKKIKGASVVVAVVFVFFLYRFVFGSSTPPLVDDSLPTFTDSMAWKFGTPTEGAWKLAIVADLDKKSRDKDAKKPTFHSILKQAVLKRVGDQYTIEWTDENQLTSQLNEVGSFSGCKFSLSLDFSSNMFPGC